MADPKVLPCDNFDKVIESYYCCLNHLVNIGQIHAKMYRCAALLLKLCGSHHLEIHQIALKPITSATRIMT